MVRLRGSVLGDREGGDPVMPRLRNKVTGAVVNVSETTAARMSHEWVDADAAQRSSEPDKTWKVDELKAYAAENGVDVSEAKNKGEVLEAIAAAGDPASDND